MTPLEPRKKQELPTQTWMFINYNTPFRQELSRMSCLTKL